MSYVKTTWVTGDIVTAPKLNNLESGVEANDLNKLNKPSGNGTAGQLLISNGDGTTSWESTDTTLAVSGVPADAKKTGDELTDLRSAINDISEDLNDVVPHIPVSGNLAPTATEKGDGGYCYNGTSIIRLTYANYCYVKMPVKPNMKYVAYTVRWWYITDENGDVVKYDNNGQVNIVTPSNAKELCATWSTTYSPEFIILMNLPRMVTLDDVKSYYAIANNISLTKKIGADVIDGFVWGNLRGALILEREGVYRYCASSTDVGVPPEIGSSATVNSYLLPVEAANYVFSESVKFLTPADADGRAIAASTQDATSYDNTNGNAKMLYVSLGVSKIDTIVISKGTLTTENTYPTWLEALKPEKQIPIKWFDHFSSDYTEEIKLDAIKSSISSNVEYVFSGSIPDWGADSKIAFILNSASGSIQQEKFEIDSTQLKVTDQAYGTPVVTTYTHGLTITNNLQLHIKRTLGAHFSVTITSNGESFTQEFNVANRYRLYPSILASDVAPTDCSFSWISRDIDEQTWCFGDSYFGATDSARWVYYLNQDGYYESNLFDNYGGESSGEAYASLTDLLKFRKPKTIFWALGMNDGSDSTSYPSGWKTNIDKVITQCQVNDIELVLATIPSVPSISHEKKNEWVRNSGYQYVDFAKAVGAQANGTWFTGMLSSDNVHPTAKGAKALYNRVLADFPAITIK